jgi:hypothetical protein
MSKTAKTRNSLKRAAEKRNRKAANVARYASYIGKAENRKRKGGVIALGKKIPGHPHKEFCGNIGCAKCFPELNLHYRDKVSLINMGFKSKYSR